MTQFLDNPDDALAALARGESLPARWYTDPAIAEQETARIFRKAWNYVGPLGELKNIGDYITGYAGGVPVVVVRNETRAGRLCQCLPAPSPRGHEGPRQRQG